MMPPVPMRMRCRLGAEPREQNFGARIGEAEQPVMLGEPVAVIAELIGETRQRDRFEWIASAGVAPPMIGDWSRTETGKAGHRSSSARLLLAAFLDGPARFLPTLEAAEDVRDRLQAHVLRHLCREC